MATQRRIQTYLRALLASIFCSIIVATVSQAQFMTLAGKSGTYSATPGATYTNAGGFNNPQLGTFKTVTGETFHVSQFSNGNLSLCNASGCKQFPPSQLNNQLNKPQKPPTKTEEEEEEEAEYSTQPAPLVSSSSEAARGSCKSGNCSGGAGRPAGGCASGNCGGGAGGGGGGCSSGKCGGGGGGGGRGQGGLFGGKGGGLGGALAGGLAGGLIGGQLGGNKNNNNQQQTPAPIPTLVVAKPTTGSTQQPTPAPTTYPNPSKPSDYRYNAESGKFEKVEKKESVQSDKAIVVF